MDSREDTLHDHVSSAATDNKHTSQLSHNSVPSKSDTTTTTSYRDRSLLVTPHDPEKSSQLSPQAQLKLNDADIDFPDGGLRAWLVCFGAGCATFASFGYVNAWGVFQAYYSEGPLRHMSPSSIAWIGSTQYALVFALGLVWGRLFDRGIFRLPLAIACVLTVAATFLVAECTKYWQFFLCQGVAIGLASGCVFGPTLAVLAHWFKRKRATAYGIVATGSSLGGTIFPIAIQNLIPKVGFPWTMRIIGFMLMGATIMLNMTIKRRLPPMNSKGGLFNPKAFKYPPFSIYTAACFVAFLGLYTLLTYIDLSANQANIDPSFDVYFLAIANAGSLFGRVLSGFLSDRFGCLTIMMPATFIAGIMTYAWPFAHSKGSLIAISVIYGFCSGTFVALLAVPLVHMGEVADVGRRTGMLMSILSVSALIGPPISGQIAGATGNYQAVGYYAGTCIVVSVAMMWIVRYQITGHLVKGKF